MRPVRAVTLNGVGLLEVAYSGGFTTTDPRLADEVVRRLDQEDPLPCPHSGDTVEAIGFGVPTRVFCEDCGEQLDVP